MINHERIIVALDGMSATKALRLAGKLSGHVWGFKVNDLLFDDPRIIKKLKKFGGVFADAKLHDIPNTVGNSVRRLSGLGADIITVHTSGGIEMMKAAKRVSGKSKIIAVTVLTSQKLSARKKVLDLARDAVAAGVDGIVCSGHELSAVKKIKGIGERLIIVPGVRPLWYAKKDDQRRTMTPDKALSLGADHIVIGRPITEAKDPLIAVRSLSS
ncbi:MAG: orotidine-5'-phosphate decarboxylase [Patescibacteria group bacterium]